MPDFNRDPREKLSLDEIESRELAEKKEKKKFNLFAGAFRDGKGVDKDELAIADNPTFVNFFRLCWRKLNQLLSVNLLTICGNFPIFFFFFAMSGYMSIHTVSPNYAVYAPLRGAMLFHNSPAVSALWTIYSRTSPVTVHTTGDYVFMGLAFLLFFTFGPVRAGVTYILRNMFRGKPVFLLQDFFDTIKRNFRQALILGILDLALLGLIIYDIVFFWLNYSASAMMTAMFFMSLWMLVLYFLMRPYLWLMLVTFDMSIWKMVKNSLRFVAAGLKRNIMVLLGTLFTAAFEYALLIVYFPLGVIFPFVILPAFLMMMGVYGAFPKIKQYMIDPYYEEVGKTGRRAEDAE